jgi:hypothetical protein
MQKCVPRPLSPLMGEILCTLVGLGSGLGLGLGSGLWANGAYRLPISAAISVAAALASAKSIEVLGS